MLLFNLKKHDKKRNKSSNTERAQTILEYVTLIGIVSIIFVTMSTYIQRGIQGMVKIVADQIGTQEGAEQELDDDGYLINSISVRSGQRVKQTVERIGVYNYIYDGTSTTTNTLQALNLGFTEDLQR